MFKDFRDKFTLGWELEAIRKSIRYASNTDNRVAVGSDGSVRGEGLEYRVVPEIVQDVPQVIDALKRLTTDPTIQTDASCGYHVHVGLKHKGMDKKLKDWAAWAVTLARLTEDDIFKAVPRSRIANQYCMKWADVGDHEVKALRYGRGKNDSGIRYAWLNIVEAFRGGGIRTIEFRLMGETHNYTQLLAWTGFCVQFAGEAWRLLGDPSHLQKSATLIRNSAFMLKAVFTDRQALTERAELAMAYKAVFDPIPNTEKGLAHFFQNIERNRLLSLCHASWDTLVAVGYPGWRDGCSCYDCSYHRRNYRRYQQQRQTEEEARAVRLAAARAARRARPVGAEDGE